MLGISFDVKTQPRAVYAILLYERGMRIKAIDGKTHYFTTTERSKINIDEFDRQLDGGILRATKDLVDIIINIIQQREEK